MSVPLRTKKQIAARHANPENTSESGRSPAMIAIAIRTNVMRRTVGAMLEALLTKLIRQAGDKSRNGHERRNTSATWMKIVAIAMK